jgi:hypothetical protein
VGSLCMNPLDCGDRHALRLDAMFMQGGKLAYSSLINSQADHLVVPGLKRLLGMTLLECTPGQRSASAQLEPWLTQVCDLCD